VRIPACAVDYQQKGAIKKRKLGGSWVLEVKQPESVSQAGTPA
jgi:hypothetical protein